MSVYERMATPARELGIVDTELELRRLEGYPRRYLCPDDLLRMDALQTRWRELHGDAVIWDELTECGTCHGTGWDGGDRYTPVLPCIACYGRGKVAVGATAQEVA